jgi:hypothetical protein
MCGYFIKEQEVVCNSDYFIIVDKNGEEIETG